MYNWSTDEKKFKNRYPPSARKIVSFLKTHPYVETIDISQKRKGEDHLIFKPKYILRVKLDPLIHPSIKTTLAMTLQELTGDLAISVVEEK